MPRDGRTRHAPVTAFLHRRGGGKGKGGGSFDPPGGCFGGDREESRGLRRASPEVPEVVPQPAPSRASIIAFSSSAALPAHSCTSPDCSSCSRNRGVQEKV